VDLTRDSGPATRDCAIGIVGAGIVGSALAVALSRAGYRIAAVTSRRPASAERLAAQLTGPPAVPTPQAVVDLADLVILAIPDDAIRGVCDALTWRAGQSVVHCSGAGTAEWLAAAASAGARVGSLHPLQTFVSVEKAIALLPESTFAIEADETLAADLAVLVTAIGAPWIRLRPEDKPVYHVAAVLVSNYLVTLTKLATDLWLDLGFSKDEARRALIPLIRGIVRSIDQFGIPECLTGPVARGDLGTIERHRTVLLERRPDLWPVYRELGRQTIPIALAKGRIDQPRVEELQDIFKSCRETAPSTDGGP
jgi:predicted short-subunit dehydrogenase-like oxidoreductase (DUF2520 family)